MNRTLKEATVRRYHYDTHQQLREHLAAFLNAYNFAKRLKTLRGLTPYEHICKAWADQPRAIQIRSNPPHFGTEHLGRCLQQLGMDHRAVGWPVGEPPSGSSEIPNVALLMTAGS